jgi:hypothetical protein
VKRSPYLTSGHEFLNALAAAGVITESDLVRRVVIDADVEGICTLYVERYGDERLLKVVTPELGAVVEVREPETSTESAE